MGEDMRGPSHAGRGAVHGGYPEDAPDPSLRFSGLLPIVPADPISTDGAPMYLFTPVSSRLALALIGAAIAVVAAAAGVGAA
jgi:hypothetical protein